MRVIADRDLGFDAAGLHFEIPVASEHDVPGEVAAGLHVGAGEGRELVHCRLACIAFCEIAAVDEYIRLLRQRQFDRCQFIGILARHRAEGQRPCTELKLTCSTM